MRALGTTAGLQRSQCNVWWHGCRVQRSGQWLLRESAVEAAQHQQGHWQSILTEWSGMSINMEWDGMSSRSVASLQASATAVLSRAAISSLQANGAARLWLACRESRVAGFVSERKPQPEAQILLCCAQPPSSHWHQPEGWLRPQSDYRSAADAGAPRESMQPNRKWDIDVDIGVGGDIVDVDVWG